MARRCPFAQEFRLLQLFLRRPGQVLAQGDILEHLYDLGAERDLNAVEVLISRLRRKGPPGSKPCAALAIGSKHEADADPRPFCRA
jgi:DNA-binding response OmpR family regulator